MITAFRNGTNSTKANVLFDEGSQRSFITEELASTLAVQSYCKEDITVSSFGAQCPLNRQVNVAVVNLVTMTGQSIPLTVLVVPRIATPLQNTVTFNVAHLPHLQNLPLAHPQSADKEFDVSLLVGADHYWDMLVILLYEVMDQQQWNPK